MSLDKNMNPLLESVSKTISDYRRDFLKIDEDHVERWLSQFDYEVRPSLLSEIDYVLKNTYISEAEFNTYAAELNDSDFVKGDPKTFWKNANFLFLQPSKSSQSTILKHISDFFKKRFGFELKDCGSEDGPYFYCEDVSYTGNQLLWALQTWLDSNQKSDITIYITTVLCHSSGHYYTLEKLKNRYKSRHVTFEWYTKTTIEDRKNEMSTTEVLRPVSIPDDSHINLYVKSLTDAGFPPVLRTPIDKKNRIFSSETGRHTLEQSFLLAGAKIRSFCESPADNMRPLGYMKLNTLGFGSFAITYRNCPNNAPLALWWGDLKAQTGTLSKWYPLLPRIASE